MVSRSHGVPLVLGILLILGAGVAAVHADDGVRTVLVEAVRPGLELKVNKGCGAAYVVGETLDVTVRSELDGYLTLFDFTTDGQVHRIFPNQHYQDSWIDRDVDYTIPGNLLPFVFRVGAPEGEELLLAIVTSCPFEAFAGENYDYSDVFPLLLLGEMAAAKTITGNLDLVATKADVALDVTYFTVSMTPQPVVEHTERNLTVTVPDAQTVWTAGSEETIHWNSESAGGTVRINYSTDDGRTWMTLLQKTPNDGAQAWHISDEIDSDACRVRVSSVEYPNIVDISEIFTIQPKPAPESQVRRDLAVTAPTGNTVWTAGSRQTVRWRSENAGTTVRVEFSSDGGSTWSAISENTGNDGSLGWSLPAEVDSNRCKVRVASRTYPDIEGISDTFTIEPERRLTITAPTASTAWTAGMQETIRWSSQSAGSHVRIQYSTDGGSSWNTVSSNTTNDGAYAWTIPSSVDSERCRVRVSSRTYAAVSASSGIFRIEPQAGSAGEVYALFVAISDYKSPENDLDHPVSQNTVASIRNAIDPWIDHVRVLNDRQATRSGILNAIDAFLGQAGPEDTVYFHFVGHGTQVRDVSGDEIDNWDEAITPYDERHITDDEIDGRFRSLSAKRAILVFESCHSGTMERGLNVFTVYDPDMTRDVGYEGGTMLDDLESGSRAPGGPSVLYMVACGPDQSATYVDTEDGVSLFALFLSLALTEFAELADDDDDAWVSFQEAFDLAARSLTKWIEENDEAEQEPMIVDRINEPVNVVEVRG